MPADDTIAIEVLREMQRREMSISRLAKKSGVDRSVLGRWLSGVRSIRVRQAVLVMRVLGLVVVPGAKIHGQGQTKDRNSQYRAQPDLPGHARRRRLD
ncbi:MAG: helix-turn-helix transcriptional regulator [Phycisphaerales bacterium]|nr:MAG: helix-turn-helix transcriptional regulator [Phycisphaerales bacterium]